MSSAATSGTARQVIVGRLSLQQELSHVFRSSALVVVGVWLYLATTLGSGGDGRRTLLPFQVLIGNRVATDQRLFRELQEGLLEAEAVRSTSGEWPAIESLIAQGIPPFAPDPTARAASYRWALQRRGAYVNYLGIPDRPGPPAWVVLIQEPEPGVPPDQTFEDEEHHRLLDGTMLHVSTWAHANGLDTPARLTSLPQAEGWTQIYAVAPGAAAPPPVPPSR